VKAIATGVAAPKAPGIAEVIAAGSVLAELAAAPENKVVAPENKSAASGSTVAAEKPHLTKEEKRAIGQAVLKRKLRLLQDPAAFLILPSNKEGHAAVKVLFAFDKAMAGIRKNAGKVSLPLEMASEAMNKSVQFENHLQDLIRSIEEEVRHSALSYLPPRVETMEEKIELAKSRNSYVFLPRSEEGRKVGLFLKKLGPLMFRYRATCQDFMRAAHLLQQSINVTKDLLTLTKELAKLTRTKKGGVTTPKGYESATRDTTVNAMAKAA